MRVLFDTSALIAALLQSHSAHELVYPWFKQVLTGDHTGVLSTHSLAELYATLTRIPLQPPLGATGALTLIRNNLLGTFEIVDLTSADYVAILEHLRSRDLVGGVTYDALTMYAAIKGGADKVITLGSYRYAAEIALFFRV